MGNRSRGKSKGGKQLPSRSRKVTSNQYRGRVGKFIDPRIYNSEFRHSLNELCFLLQEYINYAEEVFQKCLTDSKGFDSEDAALLFLYLHVLEMVDSIEILIAQACSGPALLQMRSAFEAVLHLKYIVEANYDERALAWFVKDLHDTIDTAQRFSSSSNAGQIFRTARPGYAPAGTDNTVVSVTQHYTQILNNPPYNRIEAIYQSQDKKKATNPKYHELFNVSSNVAELASHLGPTEHSDYLFLYHSWSKNVHARNLMRFITIVPNNVNYKFLRDPEDLKHTGLLATSYLYEAMLILLRKFRPGEEQELNSWYAAKIHTTFVELRDSEIFPSPEQAINALFGN